VLETWIDARASAQRQFFSQVRSRFTDAPLLDAGMQFVEAMTRQQNDLVRRLIGRVMRPTSHRGHGDTESSAAYASAAESRATEFGLGGEAALRISVPFGSREVIAPLTLRNHRAHPDSISLSALRPAADHLGLMPPELIQFDPHSLTIEPYSERTVQLVLCTRSLIGAGEYWAEILIEGAEIKRVPLVLELRPEPMPR
jgi:hypothetical protein